MFLMRTVAPLLLLAFLGQQVCLSSGNRGGSSAKSSPPPQGKFNTKQKMQCSWVAMEVGDSMKVKVKCENPEARIKGGVTERRCDFNGKPKECAGYRSNPKGYWKQVSRAFKKLQDRVCTDDRAMVKAGMCKKAPKDSHFKLDINTSVASAQSGRYPSYIKTTTARTTTPRNVMISGSSNCTAVTEERRKTAEEYCTVHWASVCSFVMSILQSEDDC